MALLTILGVGLGGGLILLLFFLILYRKSFKHKAIILRPTGDGDSHIVIEDKFKTVYNTEKKLHLLVFRKMFKHKILSPDFKNWLRVWKGDATQYNNLAGLSDQQLKQMLQFGAIFFQPTEGELKPVVVEKGKLRVLDQDNRAFIIDDIRAQQQFKNRNKDKIINALLMGGTVLVVGVVLVFFVIYFDKMMSHNIAAVCSGARDVASQSLVDVVVPG